MKKIVGIGELLWDVLPEGKQPGGAPVNFAYHATQLGFDGYAISALGKDELGDELFDFVKSKNINEMIARVDFPTGTVEVTLDSSGVPTYNIHQNVAWDNIPLSEPIVSLAQETDAVCFGTLAMRSAVSHESINKFIDLVPDSSYKIFDINLRQSYYSEQLIRSCLSKCNIFKINDDEICVLASMFGKTSVDERSFCTYLLEKFDLKYLILTKGTNGSLIMSHTGEVSEKPTPIVTVLDTVGAGDAFTAAFIASLMKEGDIYKAHEQAVKISAFVCSCKGAMPVYDESVRAVLLTD